MGTDLLALRGDGDEAAIARAASVLRGGGLVAFPTETVYGLGANALSADAVRGIYHAKRRSPDDPCIVHIADRTDLARVATIDARSVAAGWLAALADAFWPGPLSLILRRADAVPPVVSAGRPSVAVRMPAHPVALALIAAAGLPVAAPSANLFMHTSPTTARHVRDDLEGRIDLILDGGPAWLGLESTVLDLTRGAPIVLRPGGVGLEALRAVLGPIVSGPRESAVQGAHDLAAPELPEVGAGMGLPAPGMLPRHYAPNAAVALFAGEDDAVGPAMVVRVREARAAGLEVGALLCDEDTRALGAACPGASIVRLGSRDDLATVAGRLYAGLRELEARGVELILLRLTERGGLGAAIDDRMRRAASGRVIRVDENGSREEQD